MSLRGPFAPGSSPRTPPLAQAANPHALLKFYPLPGRRSLMMLMGLRYVRHEVMRANDPAPDIYRISIVVHLMSLPEQREGA